MKTILRTKAGWHEGYVPQLVGKSLFTKEDLFLFRKLKRVPSKISAYFIREKIVSVYKYSNYSYYILDKNGKIWFVEY